MTENKQNPLHQMQPQEKIAAAATIQHTELASLRTSCHLHTRHYLQVQVG